MGNVRSGLVFGERIAIAMDMLMIDKDHLFYYVLRMYIIIAASYLMSGSLPHKLLLRMLRFSAWDIEGRSTSLVRLSFPFLASPCDSGEPCLRGGLGCAGVCSRLTREVNFIYLNVCVIGMA